MLRNDNTYKLQENLNVRKEDIYVRRCMYIYRAYTGGHIHLCHPSFLITLLFVTMQKIISRESYCISGEELSSKGKNHLKVVCPEILLVVMFFLMERPIFSFAIKNIRAERMQPCPITLKRRKFLSFCFSNSSSLKLYLNELLVEFLTQIISSDMSWDIVFNDKQKNGHIL